MVTWCTSKLQVIGQTHHSVVEMVWWSVVLVAVCMVWVGGVRYNCICNQSTTYCIYLGEKYQERARQSSRMAGCVWRGRG